MTDKPARQHALRWLVEKGELAEDDIADVMLAGPPAG